MSSASDLLASAWQHHQAGDFAQAEALYRRVVQQHPNQGRIWFLLGVVCQAQGRSQEAAACYRQALTLEPQRADAHNNLGVVLEAQGDHDQAIACYRTALRHQPNHADALVNLGRALVAGGQVEEALACGRRAVQLRPDGAGAHHQLGLALAAAGRASEARECYADALRLQPEFPEAHNHLGITRAEQGALVEAVACYRQAIRLRPNYAEAHNNLGVALRRLGQVEEALACYRQALHARPAYPEALTNLGEALEQQGRWDEACTHYEQALRLRPNDGAARNNLGNVLRQLGRRAEAEACYRAVLAHQPDCAEALTNLGLVLDSQGQCAEALACFERAVQLQPGAAEALNNFGNAYKDQGRLDKAIGCYRRAVAAQPDNAALHSNLLLGLHYHPGYDPATLFAEHQRWAERHAAPLSPDPSPLSTGARGAGSPSPPVLRGRGVGGEGAARRLRIGYVSPDFRAHASAFFLEPLLSAHDRGQFEVFCYAEVARPDAVTRRLQGQAEHWRSLVGLSDTQAADLFRRDRIDILVDTAGHTANHRLLVFARKPAPIQVTWLGYPDTTGLPTMDYRLTDPVADPPGQTEAFYVEELVRLPDIAFCYRPDDGPETDLVLPRRSGPVTFGSLNNPAKVTAEAIALWARILLAVPESRLLLRTGGGRGGAQGAQESFTRHGIAAERLLPAGRCAHGEQLRLYGQVDVALDPFPYNGCTTTCETLWMGVPVLTLAGRTYVARCGASILTHLGCHEWVASTPDGYVVRAVELAVDRSRLRHLRGELRERMRRSTLTNAVRFTRQLEAALRGLAKARL